jgi:uncharacterized membrane protein
VGTLQDWEEQLMSLALGAIAAILVVVGVGYLLYLLYVWLIIRSIF